MMRHTKPKRHEQGRLQGYYLPPQDHADVRAEPARHEPSWADLVRAAPALTRYEAEACELAGSDLPLIRWLVFLRDFGEFRGLIHDAGRSAGIPFIDALNLAFTHLKATYRRARRP